MQTKKPGTIVVSSEDKFGHGLPPACGSAEMALVRDRILGKPSLLDSKFTCRSGGCAETGSFLYADTDLNLGRAAVPIAPKLAVVASGFAWYTIDLDTSRILPTANLPAKSGFSTR
ncbi:hypothetical protein AYI69_g9819 [Smittium culicis]|uniref:Uncharacterized protein n=1 Tax=Smittium culicis TaxID=133412 RepID=A0A1R1XA02_9FUNG|nr:hypothetical protein AYI69_g9819 [Smittium culicis]